WQMHGLMAQTTNIPDSKASWMHGKFTIDATGSCTISSFVENGTSQPDLNRHLSITSDGMVSITESSDSHGYLSNDKNYISITTTDGDGGYVLFILQKELLVSGDIGAQVQFVDESNGWASAFNIQTRTGELYKTTDGGNNWSSIHSLPATDETTVFYFADPYNGWMTAINDNPPVFQISKTTNGGSTWTAQYTDTTPNANTLSSSGAMQFVDSNNGWVVGPNGRILKTTNGGTDWTLLNNAGIGVNANSKCLFFLDANNGWIGTNILDPNGTATKHIILHTNNGGQSWVQQNLPFTGAVFSIFFKDANEGWFTGDQCVQNCEGPDYLKFSTGVIGHTTNGGATVVEESLVNNRIVIYPNPSKSKLFINGLTQSSVVSIFDLNGKLLINKNVISQYIDISNLLNGIYLVRIEDNSGITMKKFIKQ
ncbi:MAG TPA: T9SS type A sorting domain-containing protein, partial [Prolixibacteraceae bacterium]